MSISFQESTLKNCGRKNPNCSLRLSLVSLVHVKNASKPIFIQGLAKWDFASGAAETGLEGPLHRQLLLACLPSEVPQSEMVPPSGAGLFIYQAGSYQVDFCHWTGPMASPCCHPSVSLSLRNSLSSAWVLPGCWRMLSVYLSEPVDSHSLSVKGNLDSSSELAKKSSWPKGLCGRDGNGAAELQCALPVPWFPLWADASSLHLVYLKGSVCL